MNDIVLSREMSLVAYLLLFVAATLIWKYRYQCTKRVGISLACGILVIFAAIRYNVGTDYQNYYYMYEFICQTPFTELMTDIHLLSDIPIGMIFVGKIASLFGSVNVFFCILSALVCVPYVVSIDKLWHNKNTVLLFFIFLLGPYVTSFNIVKQMIATSICFYALQFIMNRQLWRYIGTVFLAVMFHPSAIVAIPIYFIVDKNLCCRKGKQIFIVLCCVIGFVSLDVILQALGDKWYSYTIQQDSTNISFYISLFWAILFLLYRKKLIALDNRNELLIYMCLIAVFLSFLGFHTPYLKRIAYYYDGANFILLSQLPEALHMKPKRAVSLAVTLYSLLMFVLSAYVLGQASLIPYTIRFW